MCAGSTTYTCGPAAAVTALGERGVIANEGDLAIRAHTTFAAGTPPDSLCSAIRSLYGVRCRVAYFREIKELSGLEPVIAVVKFGILVDHYVTVLDVNGTKVVIGDPLFGKDTLTHDEFAERWRRRGIVFD